MNNDFTEFDRSNEEKTDDQTPKQEQDFAESGNQQNNESAEKETKQDPSNTKKESYQFPPVAPVHRVGTVTMGFSLIAVGIIALISIFYPGFDYSLALKLSPVIFIFLGIEILSAHFFHKKARIKYDFLSGLVCFLLICWGLVLAALPKVWSYVGPEAYSVRNQLERDIEDTVYEALKDQTQIDSLYVDVEPIQLFYSVNTDYSVAANHSRVVLNIDLTGTYTDERSFAESCKQILDKLKPLQLNIRHIDFEFDDDSIELSMHLSNKLQLNLDTDRLINHVEMTRFDDDDLESLEDEGEDEELESSQEEIASSELATA